MGSIDVYKSVRRPTTFAMTARFVYNCLPENIRNQLHGLLKQTSKRWNSFALQVYLVIFIERTAFLDNKPLRSRHFDHIVTSRNAVFSQFNCNLNS